MAVVGTKAVEENVAAAEGETSAQDSTEASKSASNEPAVLSIETSTDDAMRLWRVSKGAVFLSQTV